MKKKTLLFVSLALMALGTVTAQEKEKDSCEVKITADLVSSYIWRGTIGSRNPSIQPTLAMTKGNLEIGVWGSTDFQATYKEVDPYIAYTFSGKKRELTLMVTDYNWLFLQSYFNYKNEETNHVIELSVKYSFGEDFPLYISANTMLYGSDKKYVDDLMVIDPISKDTSFGGQDVTKNNYSTYIELGYEFSKFTLVAAVSPFDSYYGDGYGNKTGFSLCNIGITSSKELQISKEYKLPLKAGFFVNPQAEDVHLVFGITF